MDLQDSPPKFNIFSAGIRQDKEWHYEMRREMQEIFTGLFLGPYAVAAKTQMDSLQMAGITHIVCVRHPTAKHLIQVNFPDHFRYLVLEIPSLTEKTLNLVKFFVQANDFIIPALKEGGKVLVHGTTGNSKSAAIVVAFLIERLQCSPLEALQRVIQKRYSVGLEQALLDALGAFVPVCSYRLQQRGITSCEGRTSVKRKLEDELHENKRLDTDAP